MARAGDALFPADAATGQVHRHVSAAIRAAVDANLTDAKLDAGLHAQARSLAAAIDRSSGLGGRKQESYALAGLHKELAGLLARIRGVAVSSDLGDLLAGLVDPEPPPAL